MDSNVTVWNVAFNKMRMLLPVLMHWNPLVSGLIKLIYCLTVVLLSSCRSLTVGDQETITRPTTTPTSLPSSPRCSTQRSPTSTSTTTMTSCRETSWTRHRVSLFTLSWLDVQDLLTKLAKELHFLNIVLHFFNVFLIFYLDVWKVWPVLLLQLFIDKIDLIWIVVACVPATADTQQLAQLQILNKAQLRQIEDLEQKLEDSRRNMRYLEHQFAIVRGVWTLKPDAS